MLVFGATIDGTVTDEDGTPVPFVTVYIEGTTVGTTTNSEGNYQLDVKEGYHTIVFRYVGYKTEVRPVTVTGTTRLDVTLKRVVFQLGEARVDGNEDPAYRIMRLARSKRRFYQKQVRDYSCKVYVKGLNYVKNLPKRLLGRSLDIGGLDETRSGLVYLSESVSEFHFKAPDKTKERVIASKVSGNSRGFTWNNATSLNFSFYDRTYNLEGLSDRDLVSPLSPSANLYYRYVYRGFYMEDSIIVNRIELIPRVKGVPLFKGHIFIQENTWRIHGADVFMTDESGIDFVDTVKMKVDFIPITEDLWMKGNLSFDFVFNVKLFKVKGWGSFSSVFSEYSVREYIRDTTMLDRYSDVPEPTDEPAEQTSTAEPKASAGDKATVFDFENWERGPIIKVESEANEKDEAFWEKIRTVPLTTLEKQDYARKDSIELIQESKAYKDSLDRRNNRPAIRNLLYGYSFSNSHRNIILDVQTPLTAVHYNTVEGYLIDHTIEFSKTRPDKGSKYSVSVNNRYGFHSGRYYGKLGFFYRFNRMNRMSLRLEGGHYVTQFHEDAVDPSVNSFYTVFLEENYMKLYEHSFGNVSWGVNAFTGFRLNVSIYGGRRRALRNADGLGGTFIDHKRKDFSPNQPENTNVSGDHAVFNDHNALIINVGFSYRPGSQYIERPDRRINLGSKWPLFRFSYEKGIGGFGQLHTDFDLLRLRISDSHSFGMAGRFKWQAGAGWFPNNGFVPFADRYHFNAARVHLIDATLDRFRALRYYVASTDQYFAEAHVEQHFDGFIFNKIPLLKKLKWQVVGGFHYLYEPAYGNYFEVTVGIENIFKIIRTDLVIPFREGEIRPLTFRVQLGL